MKNIVVSGSMQFLDDMRKCAIPIMQKGYSAILPEEDDWDSIKPEEINAYKRMVSKKHFDAIANVNTYAILNLTTLIISKKPGNTGISRDIRTEFTTDLLLSD